MSPINDRSPPPRRSARRDQQQRLGRFAILAGCLLSLLSSAAALAKGPGADDKAAAQTPPFRLRQEPAPQPAAPVAAAPQEQGGPGKDAKDGKFPPFRAPKAADSALRSGAPSTEAVAASAPEAPAPEKSKFPPWRSRDGQLASAVAAPAPQPVAVTPPPAPPRAAVTPQAGPPRAAATPPAATPAPGTPRAAAAPPAAAPNPPPAPPPAAAAQQGPEAAGQEAQAAAPPAKGLDFNLLPEGQSSATATKGPLSADSLRIERQIRLRRPLLQAHQALGFITLGAMAATMIVGQLAYVDQYTSGDFTGRYDRPHLGLSISTSVLFTATGLLALVAPNPYPKPWRLDSAAVHKITMIAATAGMVAQLVLGPITASREGKLDQPSLALAHLVTGWTTFGLFATGVVAYVF